MKTQHKAILASAGFALLFVSTAHAQDKAQAAQAEKARVEAPAAESQQNASEAKPDAAKKTRGLTVAERNLLQDRLRSAGFYKGKINGRLDEETKTALTAYQRKHGLVPTGTPNVPTLTALGILPSRMVAAAPAQKKGANEKARKSPRADGLPDPDTQLSSLSMAETRAVQQTLHRLGFYMGAIDGVAGSSTQRALRDYYQSRGLLASSDNAPPQPSPSAVKQRDIERVRGEDPPREKVSAPESTLEIEPGLDNTPRNTNEPTPRK